jgi:hypothetical protein
MKRFPTPVTVFRPRNTSRIQFPFFFAQGVKAAQISGVPEFANAVSFAPERWGELSAFEPRVLVGYGLELQRLAAMSQSGRFCLTTVNLAIFALTDCGNRPIGDALRESLWQTFGVPVYELIVAPGCRLLASECEAHDGWHLQEGSKAYIAGGELVCDLPPLKNLHTRLIGDIDPTPCACGRLTARLKNLSPRPPLPNESRLAAAA